MSQTLPDRIFRNGAIIVTIVIMTILSTGAQDNRQIIKQHYLFSDTITVDPAKKDAIDDLYDSLKGRKYKSWISRTFAKFIIVGRNTDDASIPNTDMEIAQRYFREFENREISEIYIVQANVFEQRDRNKENWGERFINSLHVLTREKQVKQNLLFKKGGRINPYTMAINERLLRNLPFLATAFIVITPDISNPEKVLVTVFARDNWSISGDININRNSTVNVYDRNFLGTGNRLALGYYHKQGVQNFGFEIKYTINNLAGTFADIELSAGVGYTNNKLRISASRPFILPSDHIYGFTAGYEQQNVGMSTIDATLLINKHEYAAWYGYSVNVDKNQGTNLYMTLGANRTFFPIRPDVNANHNPYYHNQSYALVSLGIARQNYFQGNMIYGYGHTEDIPYGYRLDITGGLHWSEFYKERRYISASFAIGEMTKLGYFNLKIGASTFFDNQGANHQTMATGRLAYFTPLFRLGSQYIRQFVNVTGTWGLARYSGEREELSYNRIADVRGVRPGLQNMGYNRLTIGGETVLFTPLFFYNFRFAFNLWGDIGWLGYDNRIFKNSISSAVGIGVRIRNERLIINSISIRLGFAVKLPENARFNPFQITHENFLNLGNFNPTAPVIMPYE